MVRCALMFINRHLDTKIQNHTLTHATCNYSFENTQKIKCIINYNKGYHYSLYDLLLLLLIVHHFKDTFSLSFPFLAVLVILQKSNNYLISWPKNALSVPHNDVQNALNVRILITDQ